MNIKKCFFLIAAVCGVTTLTWGATYKVEFSKKEAIYNCGETATFTVEILSTNGICSVDTPCVTLDNFGASVITNIPSVG